MYSSLIWVSLATVSPTSCAGHQSPQSPSQSSPGSPWQSSRRPAPEQLFMYRTSHSFGATEQKFPSLIFTWLPVSCRAHLPAWLLVVFNPGYSWPLDQVFLVLNWLVLNLYPLYFFPDPATCPIVYSFNSVQIVNKMLYTLKNSE